MISNRPKFLEDNIKFYKGFPDNRNMDADYSRLPPLLNFDFHTLNGILPLTDGMFDYIGKNGIVDGKEASIVEVNPSAEVYAYYESIGATEFQAVQLVMNFCIFEEDTAASLKGIPYSISLVPMEKNKRIDTWNINLLKAFDLRKLCQEGGNIFTGFNPFQGWYEGFAASYSLLPALSKNDYTDSIGFVWGMYFLAPIFDKKEVIMSENSTYSAQINAKYRKYKTNLYFNQFTNIKPRRIWGCDSPIELFLLQGLYVRGIHPEVQMCFFKNGEIHANYYRMQESEVWIGEEQLITAADFYLPEYKLAIFCDGKQFHDAAKDELINAKLDKLGIRILRFTGKQISENLEQVLNKVEETISA